MTATYLYTSVLDHGFVKLRNLAGPTRRADQKFDADDTDPANAARMSFDQADLSRPREADLKLSKYLLTNKHTSPFEMVEVWLEMKLPIFVARQFVRHRTVSMNEVSGRYIELPAEWYIPALEDVKFQVKDKKQGGGLIDLSNPRQALAAEVYRQNLDESCRESYLRYGRAIQAGIAREQARLFLHVNHYTHWLWKQDLWNLMHFLSLRDHSHAQGEAQCYARAVGRLLRQFLPHSLSLYDEFCRLPS